MANDTTVDVARMALADAAVKAHKLADCYGKLATELDKAPWEPRFKGRDRSAKAALDRLTDATVAHAEATGKASNLALRVFEKYGVSMADEPAEPQAHDVLEEVVVVQDEVEPGPDETPDDTDKKTWREKMGWPKKEAEPELQKADDLDWDNNVETKASAEGPDGQRVPSEK